MESAKITRFLADEEATLKLGESWAASVMPPLVVYLQGDLGAGKTTFTRGLLRGTGYQGAVKSPTYTIVESYTLPQSASLHHFDLYRFATPEEWEDAGLDDLFADDCICLIEWPQQGGSFVPPADLTVTLENHESGRKCTLEAHTDKGKKSLETWLN
ncbi:tRNA (adenosine(37)-N6)-threonylcarbamoyltransferase complex ATPase subunit type 1 TsaE [Neisseria sp. Dent CA1/247]|uniref:tRNA (adenosine(37)-N6)-threonylcarbamoyltransferase complex ATPase subunit type 1 TsaE n=1 Tax=Neisseria TaxID=482 RepID=UPI001FD4EDF6|nr:MULTISPECIES: tRNA (adenosine(37)-N6)-threonylcarbamoyltransferase complex ATPase subunit type 1 TsaE [Neisseria]MDO5069809.1 tRNA (adenosine(37)-N6)-threonylcarbamoyltransferase complex ATPase subunit type 1 TsaE [Neisseria zoodegmatis]UOO77780.1 tRNA (adenosine(37)-N6)-threonylcarbamoyltransferase complex ATPase subunit type 1 TsaE [Neisseria sp. Dent CA1/247]